MVAWLKALLFLAGGVTAATGAAYVTGMLDPWLGRTPPVVASVPQTPDQTNVDPETDKPAASEDVPLPDDPATTQKTDRLTAPGFDIVRAEPDGSVLVAGKAPADATVELLSGEKVLGSAKADASGDFVIVLDDRLPAGDYTLSLRATTPNNEVTQSTETAIVAIPEAGSDQVLVMVEEPGAPAQLLNVPEAAEATAEESAKQEEVAVVADEPAQEGAPEQAVEEDQPAQQEEVAAASEPAVEQQPAVADEASTEAPSDVEPEQVASAPQEQPAEEVSQPATIPNVAVEAVEIEGDTIFVAGRADAGSTIRVYADSIVLGDAVASAAGRFLVEAKRDLPVGNYLIRADLLSADGSVLARAAVPFEREAGENISAVAVAAADEGQAAGTRQDAQVEGANVSDQSSLATTQSQDVGKQDVAAAPVEEGQSATGAPLQRVDGSVIIRRGDNLWRISRRVYGKGVRYSAIYLANQNQIQDPNRIWPGQVFTVPSETAEGEAADLGAIAEQVVTPDGEKVAR